VNIWKNCELIFIPAMSGFSAQIIKLLLYYVVHRRINFKRLFEMGGMPSSHSAAVASLSLIVALKTGFTSVVFAVTVFFSFLVIYDAAGLRKAAGQQATILNKILDEFNKKGKFSEEKLIELIGHTPVEIIIGILYGFLLAFILYR